MCPECDGGAVDEDTYRDHGTLVFVYECENGHQWEEVYD
jgi:hypothetical protein